MLFPFSTFTSLLQRLEDVETRDPTHLPADKAAKLKDATEKWFKSHRRAINELDVQGSVALLSALLPERRTDRVYGLQGARLCNLLSRALALGVDRNRDLQAYKSAGRGDLAQCLERALKAGGPPATPPVMLVEVDDMLLKLAGQSHWSDRQVIAQLPSGSSKAKDKLIGGIFQRLSAEEGKWLVRLMLKDFAPVRVHEGMVLKLFHFLLPDLLRFQNTFEAAVTLLREEQPLRELPWQPDPRSERLFRQGAASALRPRVGVKVGRPDFLKARSIDHCLKMLGSQKWVLERKYDGEYCEIHIDLSKSSDPFQCIQIFSKSGKDSTADRQGLHQTLIDCLRLGQPDCKIHRQAILLGELVVHSDESKSVLSFDKIRKHVSRSGVFLGTEQDSQPHAHEHLAIVFFDILLLDDEVVMTKPVEERRLWLREVYRKIPGRAMGAEWKTVDFSETRTGKKRLLEQFAASIAQRCEGLVLKPCGVPYFSLERDPSGSRRCYIKLKKDYIAGLGDEADFAVVGASYNAQQALKSGVAGIKWTDFHLGCLINAAEVLRFDAIPTFQVVGTIQQEACIPKPVLQALNALAVHNEKQYNAADTQAPFQLKFATPAKIDVVFKQPFVLEVLGSGFDKPSNCSFHMLRHARATKLHRDRSWKDCVSFQALQEQANAARKAPADSELDETRRWIEKIESRLRDRLDREGTMTPSSRRTKTSSTKGAASPNTLQLDGTTLVASRTGSLKRLSTSGETPCPASKKHCPASKALGVSMPLSEITNQALGRSLGFKEAHPIKAGSNAHRRRPSRAGAETMPRSRPAPEPVASSGLPCWDTRCPFAGTTVYLSPCIANMLYVRDDLLPAHGAVITRQLGHWDRDSYAYAPLAQTVSESQAYADLRKAVLVEINRLPAVKDMVKLVTNLNAGRLKERIEIYDWRVLEKCHQHDKAAEALKRYFVGSTIYDDSRQRTIFVSTIPGLGQSL